MSKWCNTGLESVLHLWLGELSKFPSGAAQRWYKFYTFGWVRSLSDVTQGWYQFYTFGWVNSLSDVTQGWYQFLHLWLGELSKRCNTGVVSVLQPRLGELSKRCNTELVPVLNHWLGELSTCWIDLYIYRHLRKIFESFLQRSSDSSEYEGLYPQSSQSASGSHTSSTDAPTPCGTMRRRYA